MARRHETRPVRLEIARPENSGLMTAIEARAFLDELQYVPPEKLEELKSMEYPPLGPPGILDVTWTRKRIESPECVYYVIWLGDGVVGGVFLPHIPRGTRRRTSGESSSSRCTTIVASGRRYSARSTDSTRTSGVEPSACPSPTRRPATSMSGWGSRSSRSANLRETARGSANAGMRTLCRGKSG
jgi:hypothetical protein